MVKSLIYNQMSINDGNWVNIGQVDPEIICLKFILKKERNDGVHMSLAILNSGVTEPSSPN